MTSAVAPTKNAPQAGMHPAGLTRQVQPATPSAAKKRDACSESSSNEDDYSAYGAKDGEEDEEDESDGVPPPATSRLGKQTKAKAKGETPSKKTSEQKNARARAISASSTNSAPAPKRAKTSATTPSRRGPTFQGPPVPASQVGKIPSNLM